MFDDKPPLESRDPRATKGRRVPDRLLALLAVSVLLIAILGLLYRSSLERPESGGAVKAVLPETPVSSAFGDLRPSAGDQLVLPTIGFRWRFRPEAVSSSGSAPDPSTARPDSAGVGSDLPDAGANPRRSPADSAAADRTGPRPTPGAGGPWRDPTAIRFLLVLADPTGRVLLEELASASEGIRLQLPPEIGPGDYLWWVEAVPPEGSARLRSERQAITLGR